MTIAAGFVCNDGILLASDTQYSGPELRYGRKFWTITAGDATVIIGGAGTESGLKRTKEEAEANIRAGMSKIQIIKAIEGAVAYTNKLLKPKPDERTYLLVALRMESKSYLYENQEGRPVLTVINANTQCVGAGFSLGRYFADALFRENMPIQWAKIIAAHLIKNVKKYNDGWCGGDTHLFVLPDVGRPQWIRDRAVIADLESYLASVEGALSLVLPDEATSDDVIRARFQTLVSAIEKALRWRMVDTPDGSQLMSGPVGDPKPMSQEFKDLLTPFTLDKLSKKEEK